MEASRLSAGLTWPRRLTVHRQVCLPAKLMTAADLVTGSAVSFRVVDNHLLLSGQQRDISVPSRRVTVTRQVVIPRSLMEQVGISENGWVYVAQSDSDPGALIIVSSEPTDRTPEGQSQLIGVGVR